MRAMTAALDHRGPNDTCIDQWTCQGKAVSLGPTRLSILDLSTAGRQPMTEDSCSISFNGEIYNLRKLRKLLDPDNVPQPWRLFVLWRWCGQPRVSLQLTSRSLCDQHATSPKF